MERLVPALGALLLAAEVTVGPTRLNVGASGQNLSCYQCFRVPERKLCAPTQCRPGDTVCTSLIVLIRSRESRAPWQPPGDRRKLFLSKACSPKCTSTNSRYQWAVNQYTTSTIYRQCCGQSLCNRAPPTWAPRPLLLLPPLGLGLRWPLL